MLIQKNIVQKTNNFAANNIFSSKIYFHFENYNSYIFEIYFILEHYDALYKNPIK